MEHIDFTEILDRIGSPAALARLTGMSLGAAKQARRRLVIPSAYWLAISQAGVATLEELAKAGAKPSETDLVMGADLPVDEVCVHPAQLVPLPALGDRS